MELKKRAYPVVTLDSAALQGRIAVDDLAIRLQSLGAPDRSRWFGHRERRAAVSRGPCIRGALTSVKDRAPGWVHQYVLLAYWERSLYVLIRTFSSLSLSLTLYFFFRCMWLLRTFPEEGLLTGFAMRSDPKGFSGLVFHVARQRTISSNHEVRDRASGWPLACEEGVHGHLTRPHTRSCPWTVPCGRRDR